MIKTVPLYEHQVQFGIKNSNDPGEGEGTGLRPVVSEGPTVAAENSGDLAAGLSVTKSIFSRHVPVKTVVLGVFQGSDSQSEFA
jgi:hypothetical protein